ncbi:hypothetical protein D3C73_1075320 [compost metagenome]
MLDAAVAAVGAAIDDPGLARLGAVHRIALVVLEVVFVGVDGDQQALGLGVELSDESLEFVDLALICVDDQLVAIGADLAVLADEILGHGQHVGAGVIVERHDLRRGADRKTTGQ